MLSTRTFAGRSRLFPAHVLSTASRSRPTITSSIHEYSSPKFHTSTPKMDQNNLDSDTISNITRKENQITGQPNPVKGGPTAQAQKHVNESLSDSKVVSDITKGEENITHHGGPVPGGPAAFVISQATQAAKAAQQPSNQTHTGTLDSETISRITHAESELTGKVEPVKGGPTAQAQKHVGEPIGRNLHDITEAEKALTGGERVKGGPTAAAQSELSKARS